MNRHYFIALFLAIAMPANAFVQSRTGGGNARHWDLVTLDASVNTNVVNRSTRAIRYFLASDGYSTTNTAAELNAVRASFAQWQAVSGTILKFEDAGTVAPGADINTSDHRNVVFWAKTSPLVNGGMTDISGLLGITFTSFLSDGTITEADIALNGFNYDWFTDFSDSNNPAQFVESTATHEIGHFIGLAHSPVGSASMLWVGNDGVDLQAGLSSDDIAAVRYVYRATNQINARATLKGKVTKGGTGILGAAVTVEDTATNIVAGTVTGTDGSYEMPALPAGAYQVRVSPLDPIGSSDWLVRGRDISFDFDSADTGFLPTSGDNVTLTAGATNTLNIAVVAGNPAFRISIIRYPSLTSGSYRWASLPTALRPGQSNYFIGVASADLPTSGATLTLTGDGLTQGPVTFNPNAFGTGLNFISTKISVATNATPGMRTLIVQQGNDIAYANGFLEILPPMPDFNFDGLDDTFQRKYFSLFTSSNAAPNVDPDGDGFPNASEYAAGTNPTDAASLMKIDSVTHDATGTTVAWRSVAGKRYQLLSRALVGNGAWTAVGTPITAVGATTQGFDASGTTGNRFYRVQVVP